MMDMHLEVAGLRRDITTLTGHVGRLATAIGAVHHSVETVKRDILDIRRFNNSRLAEKVLHKAAPWFSLKR